ncbi:hypothetical protein [Methanobacterium sp.]|uniref:hypothetical protein n=1 Tax=Methanobacterium sp. TaxID=2164 RepID=UPI0031592558
MDPKKVANILHEGAAKLKALNNPNKYYDYSISYSVKAEPTFEPNSNLGEGEASTDEMDYRSALIAALAFIYPGIVKIVKDKTLTTDEKINQINVTIDGFTREAESEVKTHTQNIWSKANAEANKNLKNIDSNYKPAKPDKAGLEAIQNQQIQNINNVANTLKGRLAQGLLTGDIDKAVRPDLEPDISYIDNAFYEAQNRLDSTGYDGWDKVNEAGLLGAYMLGNAVLGALVADWIDMKDDSVCADCKAKVKNGPYPVMNWPKKPHFGCRCGMGVPYLLSSTTGVTV